MSAPSASALTREADCVECKAGVSFGDDGALSCYGHAADVERALIERVDLMAPKLGLKRTDPKRLGQPDRAPWGHKYLWPAGAEADVSTRERLATWAVAVKAKRGQTSCGCLKWLDRRSCYGACAVPAGAPSWWSDHRTAWIEPRYRVLVMQPAALTEADRAALAELATAWRFGLEISPGPAAWLGHAEAVMLRRERA